MDKSFLQEAFKALDVLNEEDFDLNTSDAIDDLKIFIDDDNESDDIFIIDPEADTEEELEDDYIGKVILDCEVCHSKIYEAPENIIVDDESSLVNVEEECPFCFSNEGYKIVGMVSPYEETKDVIDISDDKTDDLDESCKVSKKSKRLKENETEDKNIKLKTECKQQSNMYEGIDKWLGKSIASALQAPKYRKRLDTLLNTSRSLNDIKDSFCNLINSTDVSDDVKKKACARVNNLKNMSAMYSTIGTYLTGDKIINPSKVGANESLEKIEIEPEEDKMEFTTGTGNKITITSEDKDDEEKYGEIIVPVDKEVEDIIDDNNEEDEIEDTKEVDVDFEDFDEETFDELGESYLKKIYNNVNSFNTQSVEIKGNNLIIEGLIKFNSGNKKKTRFIFESHMINEHGILYFIGENKDLSSNRRAFRLCSYINEGRLINESLSYNYRTRNKDGKAVRLHGNIRCNERLQSQKVNEEYEIFHNDNGLDYKIIERSKSGRNALLNRGKQWIVAWDCPISNEGSWGQGHYFFDENDARRFWEDNYLYESKKVTRNRKRR